MTRMRFRTDSIADAEDARRIARGEAPWADDPEDLARIATVPPAAAGDTWRLEWHTPNERKDPAGYAICCPKCGEIHYWSSAGNCESKRKVQFPGTDGTTHEGWTCDHQQARVSCWTWTGSAEANTLTAYASLFANGEGACGWHGWLKDGVLAE